MQIWNGGINENNSHKSQWWEEYGKELFIQVVIVTELQCKTSVIMIATMPSFFPLEVK